MSKLSQLLIQTLHNISSPVNMQHIILNVHLQDFNILLNNFYHPGIQKNIALKNQEIDIINNISKILRKSNPSRIKELIDKMVNFCYEIILLNKITQIKNTNFISNSSSIYKCYCYKNHNLSCGNKIIRAHTISRSNNFINNKYYSFHTSLYDKYISYKLSYKEVDQAEASTALIFCDTHDSNLFAPIEKKLSTLTSSNLDLNIEYHYRLQNYRIYYKREVEDLEANLIIQEFNKQIITLAPNNCIIQKLKQLPTNTNLSLNYINTLEHDIFKKNLPNKTLYFSIELNNDVSFLVSSSGDGSYLFKEVAFGQTNLFFHILQNKDNPCIIFSTFDTEKNKNLLIKLRELYKSNIHEFWETVVTFSCLNENIFFTEGLIKNITLFNKLLNHSKKDSEYMINQQYSKRLIYNNRIKLVEKEIQFLFNPKKSFENF